MDAALFDPLTLVFALLFDDGRSLFNASIACSLWNKVDLLIISSIFIGYIEVTLLIPIWRIRSTSTWKYKVRLRCSWQAAVSNDLISILNHYCFHHILNSIIGNGDLRCSWRATDCVFVERPLASSSPSLGVDGVREWSSTHVLFLLKAFRSEENWRRRYMLDFAWRNLALNDQGTSHAALLAQVSLSSSIDCENYMKICMSLNHCLFRYQMRACPIVSDMRKPSPRLWYFSHLLNKSFFRYNFDRSARSLSADLLSQSKMRIGPAMRRETRKFPSR